MAFQHNTFHILKLWKQMSDGNQCVTLVGLMRVAGWRYPQLTRTVGRRILSSTFSLARELGRHRGSVKQVAPRLEKRKTFAPEENLAAFVFFFPLVFKCPFVTTVAGQTPILNTISRFSLHIKLILPF